MLEILSMPFMQRALLAGLLLSVPAGYFGVFVVQRRLSFLGDGLAHAAFGGVALGLLLGGEPLWVALPFTFLTALAIARVRRRTELGADTAIGIFFAVAMALGILFLSLRRGYSADAFTYLFGSILTVNELDLYAAGGLAALTLLSIPLWGRLSFATFDAELASSDGVPVARDDDLLFVLVALCVVVAAKILGVVLIAAFLVIPPATARLLTRSFFAMTLCSIALCAAGALLGLAVSCLADVPSGAAIILTQAAFFLLALPLGVARRA